MPYFLILKLSASLKVASRIVLWAPGCRMRYRQAKLSTCSFLENAMDHGGLRIYSVTTVKLGRESKNTVTASSNVAMQRTRDFW